MKKQLLLFLIFFLPVGMLVAKPVTEPTAAKVAENFGLLRTGTLNGVELVNNVGGEAQPDYYIYNFKGRDGFVIIAADDASRPILGYSLEGDFVSDQQGPAFKAWISNYERQIEEIRNKNLQADDRIINEWIELLYPVSNPPQIAASVGPLLTTKWNQDPYFNDLCPFDQAANERTVTGCVATAMSQIMKYWSFPAQGNGANSYELTYGVMSANFAATTYNWAAMPDEVNSTNQEVARLLFHAGVAIRTNYNTGASGGSSAYATSGGDMGSYCATTGFINYFKYDPGIEDAPRERFSDAAWIQKIKDNLNNNQPLLYAGGAHAWVCDGYDQTGYFHMNWGWGGYHDGYYSIDYLNPGTGGTGSGSGQFNFYETALFKIKPSTPQSNPLPAVLMYTSALAINNNPIAFMDGFTLNADIKNIGQENYSGRVAALILDSAYNQVAAFLKDNFTVNAANTATLSMSTPGIAALTKGKYLALLVFETKEGDWWKMRSGLFQNYVEFQVVDAAEGLKLATAISVSPSEVEAGQPVTVSFKAHNKSASKAFTGKVRLNLLSSTGVFIRELYTSANQNVPANADMANPVTYTIPSFNEAPGTYTIQAEYYSSGGTWEIISAGSFQNPVSLVVTAPDIYEVNNTETDAFEFVYTPVPVVTKIETPGSNIHSASDVDYYKIALPSGKNSYGIKIRIYDNQDASAGTFTNNVGVVWKSESTWTADLKNSGEVFIGKTGGTVYFLVKPEMAGDRGTYLLKLEITEYPEGAVKNISAAPLFSVFPNPVVQGDVVTIISKGTVLISKIEVTDSKGAVVQSSDHLSVSETTLKTDLPSGVYYVRVTNSEGIQTYKLVVTK